MKRILILLVLCICIYSCGKSRNELIVGKWNWVINGKIDTSVEYDFYANGIGENFDLKKGISFKYKYEWIDNEASIRYLYPDTEYHKIDTMIYKIVKLKGDILITQYHSLSFVFKRK